MTDQACILILLFPLFGALLAMLLGIANERFSMPIAITALTGSLACALVLLGKVVMGGPVDYFLGGWSEPFGVGIQYRVDGFNALLLVVISGIALVTMLYSRERAPIETPNRLPQFYALAQLLTAGLMGMSITADAFNLYVLLEVASLTSYALVAMGDSKRAAHAAFNYVIMGTVGASFYLLGVGYLYIKTGSLNMLDIREILMNHGLYASKSVHIAFIMILVGVWVKMAFFPLHGWLPNAYTYAPSSTGSLIAPLMTKVSVYVMIRMMLTVFGVDFVFDHLHWCGGVVWLAVLAIFAGSIMALPQTSLKRMLSYLIVAEVGYMVGGAWLSTHYGMVGAFYHVLSDAAMTSCLFLAASIFYFKTGSHSIFKLEGAFRKMPMAMAAFTVGALSMIGIPPTCGFFSKLYLIRGALEAGRYEFVVALLVSSLINAILFFRILEIAFFGKLREDTGPLAEIEEHHERVGLGEPPASMLTPLVIMAGCVLALGWFNAPIVRLIQETVTAYGLPGGGM